MRDSSDVERIEVLDTLKEFTTITVQVNEAGDTLRQSIVTDRLRSRDHSQVREKSVEIKVIHDTVYVAMRDSVYVSNTNLTNPTNKGGGFRSTLKWIFWIIIGLIALIITAKVCLRK